jgi:hypothetical protein
VTSPVTCTAHTPISSLQNAGHFILSTVYSNGARFKLAMKDEGGINKLKDFSETTYCKCDRLRGREGDSLKYSEK